MDSSSLLLRTSGRSERLACQEEGRKKQCDTDQPVAWPKWLASFHDAVEILEEVSDRNHIKRRRGGDEPPVGALPGSLGFHALSVAHRRQSRDAMPLLLRGATVRTLPETHGRRLQTAHEQQLEIPLSWRPPSGRENCHFEAFVCFCCTCGDWGNCDGLSLATIAPRAIFRRHSVGDTTFRIPATSTRHAGANFVCCICLTTFGDNNGRRNCSGSHCHGHGVQTIGGRASRQAHAHIATVSKGE